MQSEIPICNPLCKSGNGSFTDSVFALNEEGHWFPSGNLGNTAVKYLFNLFLSTRE